MGMKPPGGDCGMAYILLSCDMAGFVHLSFWSVCDEIFAFLLCALFA